MQFKSICLNRSILFLKSVHMSLVSYVSCFLLFFTCTQQRRVGVRYPVCNVLCFCDISRWHPAIWCLFFPRNFRRPSWILPKFTARSQNGHHTSHSSSSTVIYASQPKNSTFRSQIITVFTFCDDYFCTCFKMRQ